MVSIAWVMWAFLFGGLAGMAILVLMCMAGREDERAARADAAARHGRLGPVPLESHWGTTAVKSARLRAAQQRTARC